MGGLRTALMSYLVAKKEGGVFALRIEDTDQAREVPGATESILRALAWAGIAPDEGMVLDAAGRTVQRGAHGPYKQSERLALYRAHADLLLQGGHAYHCFCTPERLEEMRAMQQAKGQAPMYDRRCRALPPEEALRRAAGGEKHVVRMKVPDGRTVAFDDDIRGAVSFQSHTIDDQVLLKGDGFPTYHLAHVVDDRLMDTTVVIRGEEWLSSLPKHLLLFEMLGWQPPRYAHVPLLLNADRTKLSKRQGSVSVEEYMAKGYLPEALLNFIALLGWNPGTTQELFTLKELVEQFSLDRVQKAGAVFDTQKLDWLQGQWMRAMPPEAFSRRVQALVAERIPSAARDADFAKKAALIHDRITFLHEAPDMLGYFYVAPVVAKALVCNAKQKVTEELLPRIVAVLEALLADIPEASWNAETLLARTQEAVGREGLKLGQLLWPLRAVLTGREFSPGAVEVAHVLGKAETLARLRAFAG